MHCWIKLDVRLWIFRAVLWNLFFVWICNQGYIKLTKLAAFIRVYGEEVNPSPGRKFSLDWGFPRALRHSLTGAEHLVEWFDSVWTSSPAVGPLKVFTFIHQSWALVFLFSKTGFASLWPPGPQSVAGVLLPSSPVSCPIPSILQGPLDLCWAAPFSNKPFTVQKTANNKLNEC